MEQLSLSPCPPLQLASASLDSLLLWQLEGCLPLPPGELAVCTDTAHSVFSVQAQIYDGVSVYCMVGVSEHWALPVRESHLFQAKLHVYTYIVPYLCLSKAAV